MIRTLMTCLGLALVLTLCGQHQMNWGRLADDTIYYANEYVPDHIRITSGGPGQQWDFRSLRAPYALSRRILIGSDRESYAQLANGKAIDAILKLNGRNSEIIKIIDENPVCPARNLTYTMSPSMRPFYHNIFGSSYEYNGKMQATFSWPRDIKCTWTPLHLPDSCRITYTLSENILVDADGTLYLPTEVSFVYRQKVTVKKVVKVETKKGNVWRDVTSEIPGLQLITYKDYYRFVSSDDGLLLAEVETDDHMQPVRAEFKTHPLVTRIFSEEPSRPDIFAYPNPSFDVVRFQLSDLLFGRYKLKLFNILGIPVKELDIDVDHPRETITLDLGDLQRGTYLYRLSDSFGRTIRAKRVVLIQP